MNPNYIINLQLKELINELRRQGIRTTKALSDYIRSNNLQEKYPALCGEVEMDNTFSFPGLNPNYYNRVCREANIVSKGDRS